MADNAVACCMFTNTHGAGVIQVRGCAYLPDGRFSEFSLDVTAGVASATLNTQIIDAVKDALTNEHSASFDVTSVVNIVGGLL